MARSVLVVGGGVAGLACAGALAERGARVVVVDKGRRPAGRCATRHAGRFDFDHGAQYVTARDPGFRRVVAGWLAAGVVASWDARFVALERGRVGPPPGEDARYVGVPGMSAVARALAEGLDVRRGRVVGVERAGGAWRARLAPAEPVERGGHAAAPSDAALPPADALVLALPPEQARALAGDGSRACAAAARVTMRPCWAALLGLATRWDVPFDAAFASASPLTWLARNAAKPGRPAGESWVLHADAAWTEARLDAHREAVVAELAAAAAEAAGAPLPPLAHADAHLWRYARADSALDAGALHDRDRALVLAGDWCAGSRVEGAWRSGRVAAELALA